MPPHSSYLKSKKKIQKNVPKNFQKKSKNKMYMAFEKIWLWFFFYIPPMYCINSFSRRGRRIGEGPFFFMSFLALQDKQILGFYNMLIIILVTLLRCTQHRNGTPIFLF